MSFGPHMGGIHRAWHRELLHNSIDHSSARHTCGLQSFLEQRSRDFRMLFWECILTHTNCSNQNQRFWVIDRNPREDFLASDLCDRCLASGCKLYLRSVLESTCRLVFPSASGFARSGRIIHLPRQTPLPDINLSLSRLFHKFRPH